MVDDSQCTLPIINRTYTRMGTALACIRYASLSLGYNALLLSMVFALLSMCLRLQAVRDRVVLSTLTYWHFSLLLWENKI